MLNLINEELMAYSTITVTEREREYTKIRVTTSNKLYQYENDSRYNKKRDDREVETPKKQIQKSGATIVSNVDDLKPINREIIRISAPLKNIGEFEAQTTKSVEFDLPMSINVNAKNKYQPNVEVRCHESGDDRANLYVIAFPFNGMIKPIPENPQYRIYKGLIASSAKPFFFNNRKYRKVLYLVIEINKNLFNPEHKYHTDNIKIQLESFALFTDRTTDERKTNCEVFTIDITSPNGEYTANWNYETVDEAILMGAEPGRQLWVTYDVTTNKNQRNQNYNNQKRYNNNSRGNRPMTTEGDMYVTTNRHGIRKEIPMQKNNYQRNQRQSNYNNNQVKTDKSLDQMIQKSGMYDNDYESRSQKNSGSRRNNSRGKNNKNRY